MGVAGPTALVQFAFVAIAFRAGRLLRHLGFLRANVFENSHSAMPLIYKFTSVWGNHEGSMLLWVLILSLFGALVAAFGGNLPATLKANVLAVQSWIAAAFYLFILVTSNPFLRSPTRRSRAATLIRSFRTWASRSIRRCSTSAMSASRSRSRSRLPR